jgi:hypothetical protein
VTNERKEVMDELRNYLSSQNPDPIEETSRLESLLAGVWHTFGGDDGGMAGHKLIGRMESVEWQPPILSFRVERHGGTVLGSTRAEMQHWTVDLDRRTATSEQAGHRQLSPMARRVDVVPIAHEIASLIAGGVIDERLRWLGDGRVRVEMGKIIPKLSGYKQTVQGRRTRLREALIEALVPKGWIHLGRNNFSKEAS